jgi:5-methylcytosine-specific restriction endonuclease McrA
LQQKRPIKYYSPKRRAIYEQGDDINHLILFELHNWICWVCRGPINRRLRFPNYSAATVEHIVPLCKGGTHTWDNVAPSHARCNFEKGDRHPDEITGPISV